MDPDLLDELNAFLGISPPPSDTPSKPDDLFGELDAFLSSTPETPVPDDDQDEPGFIRRGLRAAGDVAGDVLGSLLPRQRPEITGPLMTPEQMARAEASMGPATAGQPGLPQPATTTTEPTGLLIPKPEPTLRPPIRGELSTDEAVELARQTRAARGQDPEGGTGIAGNRQVPERSLMVQQDATKDPMQAELDAFLQEGRDLESAREQLAEQPRPTMSEGTPTPEVVEDYFKDLARLGRQVERERNDQSLAAGVDTGIVDLLLPRNYRRAFEAGLSDAFGVIGSGGRAALGNEDTPYQTLVEQGYIEQTPGEVGAQVAGAFSPIMAEIYATRGLAGLALLSKAAQGGRSGQLLRLVAQGGAGSRGSGVVAGVLEGTPSEVANLIETQDLGTAGAGSLLGGVMGGLVPGGRVSGHFAKGLRQDPTQIRADMLELIEAAEDPITARTFASEQLIRARANAAEAGDAQVAQELDRLISDIRPEEPSVRPQEPAGAPRAQPEAPEPQAPPVRPTEAPPASADDLRTLDPEDPNSERFRQLYNERNAPAPASRPRANDPEVEARPQTPEVAATPAVRVPDDVRPARENINEVVDASFMSGRVVGDEVARVDDLRGGIGSAANDHRRVEALVDEITGPDGYWERIIVDQDDNVVEGAHRLEAARLLGFDEVPVTRIADNTASIDETVAHAALKGRGLRSDQRNQLVGNVGEMVADAGSVRAAREAYDLPRGFEDHYNTVLDALEGTSARPAEAPVTPRLPDDVPPVRPVRASDVANDPDGAYVYHVTSEPNARSIMTDGFRQGQPTAGRGGSYPANSAGRTFFTDKQGVSEWVRRIEAHLFDQFDDPPPISVLRVRRDALESMLSLKDDPIQDVVGSKSMMANTDELEGLLDFDARFDLPEAPVTPRTPDPDPAPAPRTPRAAEEPAGLPRSGPQPEFFRETDIESAMDFIPGSHVLREYDNLGVYASNVPEMALGQGRNRGVLLEFDGAGLGGYRNDEKPGLEFTRNRTGADEFILYNDQQTYQDALRAVTVDPQHSTKLGDFRVIPMLDGLVENKGWTRTELPDGKVRYERPKSDAPTSSRAAEEPAARPEETPEPPRTARERVERTDAPSAPKDRGEVEARRMEALRDARELDEPVDAAAQLDFLGGLRSEAGFINEDLLKVVAPATFGGAAGATAGAYTSLESEDAASRAVMGAFLGIMAGLSPSFVSALRGNSPTFNKYFAAGGVLPGAVKSHAPDLIRPVRKAMRLMSGQAAEADRIIQQTMADLAEVVEDLYGNRTPILAGTRARQAQVTLKGNPFESMPEKVVRAIDGYISGTGMQKLTHITNIPAEMRPIIRRMRAQVDEYSRIFLKEGMVDGELTTSFQRGIGMYLRRSYRTFDDPEWLQNAPKVLGEEEWARITNEFKAWYRSMLPDEINPSPKEMERIMEDWATAGEDRNPLKFIKSGRLGKVDATILARRKNIPVQVRRLWGEYTDPKMQYVRTITNQAYYIANYRFLRELAEVGNNSILWRPEIETVTLPSGQTRSEVKNLTDRPEGFTYTLSKSMGPMEGWRTTPEIGAALEAQFVGEAPIENMLVRGAFWLNTSSKLSKTILSQVTQLRNVVGNVQFFNAQGMLFDAIAAPGKTRSVFVDAVKGMMEGGGMRPGSELLEEFNQGVRLGVLDDSARAEELQAGIDELRRESRSLTKFMDNPSATAIARLFRRGMGGATGLYRSGDDVWKLIAWKVEKVRYAKAFPDASADEVAEIAAQAVRDTWPTFSQTPEAVNQLRKVGGYISFPSEVLRATIGTFEQIKRDLARPETRSIGIKRIAGVVSAVSAIPTAIAALDRVHGITKADREAARTNLPPWSRNSQIAFLSPVEDGKATVYDMSYTDPLSYYAAPMVAFMRGDDWRKAAGEVFKELMAPFASASPLASELWQYAQESDRSQNPTIDGINALWEGLEPGVVDQHLRLLSGRMSSGRQVDRGAEMLALTTGQRLTEIDARESLEYAFRPFARNVGSAKSDLSKAIDNDGFVSRIGEITGTQQIFMKMLRGRTLNTVERMYYDAARQIRGAIWMGVPEREVRKIVDKYVSTDDLNLLFEIAEEMTDDLNPRAIR